MAKKRSYDDGCAAAHALDLIGERWALLVARELMFGPKRFSGLKADLRTITPNVLAQRLDDLEAAGIVVRRRLPPPAASWVYELTPWGRKLEPVLRELGRWAAQSPTLPQGRPISATSLILSLRTLFDPAAAGDARLHLSITLGETPFDVTVENRVLDIESSPSQAQVDATILTVPQTLDALLYEGADLDRMIAAGELSLTGDRQAFKRFLAFFPLPLLAHIGSSSA
ncbi:MAG: winged helix-turn-helix transcriptional regulator, partial [Pigmentiphaga sp.]